MATLTDFSSFTREHPFVGVFIAAGASRYIVKRITDEDGAPALLVFGRAAGVQEVILDSDDPDFAASVLVDETRPIPEWERPSIGVELARLTGTDAHQVLFLAGRDIPTA